MSETTRLWTVAEIAAHYRLHPDTVRKWIRCDVLKVVRVGPAGEIRVPAGEVTRLARATEDDATRS